MRDVVCLSVGAEERLEYVERLFSMLCRWMPGPFSLHCITDRPRALPPGVTAIDASGWPPPRSGMRATTYKLGLYTLPFDEFLYLDTTLVIQRELEPLLRYAASQVEDLVAIKDWTYDATNTCVMRIRTGGALGGITQAYADGVVYPQKVPGDQDFVTAFLQEVGGAVAHFPREMVASYKLSRSKARQGSAEGKADLERATIVKFHGEPKMHELLDPTYRLLKLGIMKPKSWWVDSRFWVRELEERWR